MVLREVGDGLAAAVDELETLLREVGAVTAQAGHGLFACDRRGHIPVGAELDEAHGFVEQGGVRLYGLADDDLHGQGHGGHAIAHLIGAQHELRHVDHDHAGCQLQRRPAQVFHGQRDLPRALGGRDLHLGQRAPAHHAIGRQRVALLESLDAFLQRGVVGGYGLCAFRQVAQCHESLGELRQAGPGLAGFELALARKWRQGRGPGRMVGQRAVVRQQGAQAGIQRHAGGRGAQGVGKVRGGQCRLQVGRGVEVPRWQGRELCTDLARVDAAGVQVGQIAVQCGGQCRIQLLGLRIGESRPLGSAGHGQGQCLGVVILGYQALGAGIGQHFGGLPCGGGGAPTVKEDAGARGLAQAGQPQGHQTA